jgi:NAD(P)-dependent dehydrogenase (short-subunit alcohol dehydrogenase family)
MRTVLVTGANRGIGLEFVRQYAEGGDRVIAGVRDPDGATDLKAIADASDGRVSIHRVDVSDDASVAAFRKDVGDQPVDILLAVAGVMGPEKQQRLGELDFPGWLGTLSVNALGPVRLADAFVDNVRKGRAKKMIAITSGMGSTAESGGGYLAYRMSKAGLNNAWRNISIELKGDRIVCVALNPGWVKTDMGGPSANITVEQSVSNMRKRIDGYGLSDSGRFLSWDGKQFGW